MLLSPSTRHDLKIFKGSFDWRMRSLFTTIAATRTATHTAAREDYYDPRYDYCFMDEDNDKVGVYYCWYHKDSFPVGYWKGVTGAGYDNCGPPCTKVRMYDPSQDLCFSDKDNDDKYCWYPQDNLPCSFER